MTTDKEYMVIISEEDYKILNFKQEGLPGIAVINKSLVDFQPKEVFAWHCSIMLECEKLIDNGMPSKDEVKVLDQFGDFLDENIKGLDREKPNALFLARITWDETRELIWRVFDPKIINNFLTNLTEEGNHPRNFDYSIDPDKEWQLAKWHLNNSGPTGTI